MYGLISKSIRKAGLWLDWLKYRAECAHELEKACGDAMGAAEAWHYAACFKYDFEKRTEEGDRPSINDAKETVRGEIEC